MSNPKLNHKEETSTKKTRSPPKRAKVEQSVPKKEKAENRCGKGSRKSPTLEVRQGGADP